MLQDGEACRYHETRRAICWSYFLRPLNYAQGVGGTYCVVFVCSWNGWGDTIPKFVKWLSWHSLFSEMVGGWGACPPIELINGITRSLVLFNKLYFIRWFQHLYKKLLYITTLLLYIATVSIETYMWSRRKAGSCVWIHEHWTVAKQVSC